MRRQLAAYEAQHGAVDGSDRGTGSLSQSKTIGGMSALMAVTSNSIFDPRNPLGVHGTNAVDLNAEAEDLIHELSPRKQLTAEEMHTIGSLRAQQRVTRMVLEKKRRQEEENRILDELLEEKRRQEIDLQKSYEQSLKTIRKAAATQRDKKQERRSTSATAMRNLGTDVDLVQSRKSIGNDSVRAVQWSLSPVPTLNVPAAQEKQRNQSTDSAARSRGSLSSSMTIG